MPRSESAVAPSFLLPIAALPSPEREFLEADRSSGLARHALTRGAAEGPGSCRSKVRSIWRVA